MPDQMGLRPKLFSLSLIYLLSSIPFSILGVNFIHKFYFHPNYYLVFSTYTVSYVIFGLAYLLLFTVVGIFLYMKEKQFSFILIGVSLFSVVLSILLFYISFDTYSYVDQSGIYINRPTSLGNEEHYKWSEVKEIIQLNNSGLPAELEIVLIDKKIKLNLQADWYAKRRGFYEYLREFNVPISSIEKQ